MRFPRAASFLAFAMVFSCLHIAAAQEAGALNMSPGDSGMTIEQFLQSLSSTKDVFSRKDIFIKAPPPFDPSRYFSGTDDIIPSNPVLERYPIKEYTIMAVLLGDQYPRALVKVPNNKVYVLKVRDRLGSRRGMVTKITNEGVTVLESRRSPLGFIDKAEINLAVGAKFGAEKEKTDDVNVSIEGKK